MSLKQNQSLLEENIKLKRENNGLLTRIDEMNNLLKRVSEQVAELSGRPVNTIVMKSDQKSESIQIKAQGPIFIPTPSSEGLSSNISDLKVTSKESNIRDSVDKLSKVNETK